MSVSPVLLAGKDATDDFESFGHSKEARKQLDEFYIGDLDDSAPESATQVTHARKRRRSSERFGAPVTLSLRQAKPSRMRAEEGRRPGIYDGRGE